MTIYFHLKSLISYSFYGDTLLKAKELSLQPARAELCNSLQGRQYL